MFLGVRPKREDLKVKKLWSLFQSLFSINDCDHWEGIGEALRDWLQRWIGQEACTVFNRIGRPYIHSKVVETVWQAEDKNHFLRHVVLLITLDIKNTLTVEWYASCPGAFVPLPLYLLRMAEAYLRSSALSRLQQAEVGPTSRVAQELILSPDLCNVICDGLLRPGDVWKVGVGLGSVLWQRWTTCCRMRQVRSQYSVDGGLVRLPVGVTTLWA